MGSSPPPPSPHHPGFYRPESKRPPRWSLCLSLSLHSQKLSITHMFWLLVSKGLGNLLKWGCCPGSLQILTAKLHPTLTGWILNILNVAVMQSSVWANDPKYLIVSALSSWYSMKQQRFCFTWCSELRLLKLRCTN